MTSWVLWLHLHAMAANSKEAESTQVIEIKGFSSKEDCEKAADAAGKVFLVKEGSLNSMSSDCKQA